MPRRRTFVVLAVVGALCLMTYGVVCHPFDPFDGQAFSSQRWQQLHAEDRRSMARNAIRLLPVGTQEAKVIATLGNTKDVRLGTRMVPNGIQNDRTLVYDLGSGSGWYDAAFLFVHMDPSGKVRSAEVGGY